jgi:SAM-dependent methyltransferase
MIVDATEGGRPWSELARLDSLAAVLDPDDTGGGKNRSIDRVHKHVLRRVAGDLRGKSVLDFGCGTGRLSGWLRRQGACVIGADVTPEMVEAARARVSDAEFYVMEGSSVPCRDGTFDVVVTAYVLQYYLRDRAVFSEVARVLRSGGQLVAIEQVSDGGLGRGGRLGEYEGRFSDSGFQLREARPIRAAPSRFLDLAQRYPRLSYLPGLPWLIQWEVHRVKDLPLTGGRYADFVFIAAKCS